MTKQTEAQKHVAFLHGIFISEEIHATKAEAIANELHRLETENTDLKHALEIMQSVADDLSQHKAARMAYASEFPRDADGDFDVGNIHANIRAMKQANKELLEALISFTRSDYIKRQHPKRYANAKAAIAKHGGQHD